MTAQTATKKRERERADTKVNSMTEEEVIALMKTTQGGRSLRAFAAELKVTPAYLSDIYNGRRSPGPAVLKFFGIDKQRQIIVEYAFFRK